MLIKSQKDFFAGLMFAAVGLGFAIGAENYSLGSAARMGPGYFPMLLGYILFGIGALIAVLALKNGKPDGDKVGAWAWRPLLLVLGANMAFGALMVGVPALGIPQLGFMVAIIALTFIASLAGLAFNFKEVAILSVVLAVGSYIVFVKLLNLQFPVWPAFMGY